MSKPKKEQKPRWMKRQYVWFCIGCKAVKAPAKRVLKVKYGFYFCEEHGNQFLEQQKQREASL